jgi:hypothetical protein
MLRLHWRRPAIRGKIESRRLSVAHKSQRLIGTLRRGWLDHVLIVGEQHRAHRPRIRRRAFVTLLAPRQRGRSWRAHSKRRAAARWRAIWDAIASTHSGGLEKLGWIAGKSLQMQYRWANGSLASWRARWIRCLASSDQHPNGVGAGWMAGLPAAPFINLLSPLRLKSKTDDRDLPTPRATALFSCYVIRVCHTPYYEKISFGGIPAASRTTYAFFVLRGSILR